MLPSRIGVGRMRPGDHACLVHESAEERASAFAVFIGDGLVGRQKVFLLSAEGRGPHEAAGFLSAYGIDPGPYLLSGQLAVGGSGPRSHHMLPQLVGEALRRGAPAVRICRDAPRSAPGALLPRAELDLDGLPDGLPVVLLCAYDERVFAVQELAAALAGHRACAMLDPLYEDGLLQVTRRFRPPALRLEGDVDSSNINGLARVLAAELRRLPEREGAAGTPVPMRLDVSGLDFIDVGGMRLLVRTALALNEQGGRLVLAGLAPHLRRVMRVVGWDGTPGLELAPRFPRHEPGIREITGRRPPDGDPGPPEFGASALSA